MMAEWESDIELPEEETVLTDDGRELFEHFRFEADKGQQLLRVDKFLVERMQRTSRNRILPTQDASSSTVRR